MVARRHRDATPEPLVRIICADVLEGLRGLPDGSVHCVVTSPPYWGLRDYGTGDRQIGLEETPQAYVDKLVAVFREVWRVLRPDGTVWLNLGDSYSGSWEAQGHRETEARPGWRNSIKNHPKRASRTGAIREGHLKSKDLVGIPWRVALALQADGWGLRQDIIWSKPNPMPESVTDRCTKAHEYIFLLSKSADYYFDQQAIAEQSIYAPGVTHEVEREKGYYGGKWRGGGARHDGSFKAIRPTRNKRSVWTVPSAPFSEAHFAVFPPALIEPCIKAGTSARGCCPVCGAPWAREVERKPMKIRRSARTHSLGRTWSSGTVEEPGEVRTVGWSPSCRCASAASVPATILDPFGGAGTTGLVAMRLGRSAVLIDLSPGYCAMAARRLRNDEPLLSHRVQYV